MITDDDPGGTSPFRRIRGFVIAGVPVSEDAHDTPTRDRAVLVDAEDRVENLPCAVVFDLPDFDLDGSMIRMRALDDLAGCAAVLALLRASTEFETPGAVHGLFTRAEEVGLVGARLAAADGLLPKDTIVVSVESSRTLPGAEIGRGPVIRVGDARTTFDAGRRGIPRNGQRPTCKRRGVQESTTAYERRSVRGDGVFRIRIPNNRNGISARQLP